MKRELPDGWTWVKLDDVARKVRHTVKDHAEEGIEWAVRGEDFESGSLRLGGRTPVEQVGPTFVKRFEPGHVLFMTRRAYLRKAAVADFTGVVANTTEVLEAKPDRLLPELFPFVLQSDAFVDYAVEMSVGSTNPYVKWTDLKRYSLPLPPMDRQRELVEVFRGVEDVTVRLEEARRSSVKLHTSLLVDFCFGQHGLNLRLTGDETMPEGWAVVELGEVVTRVQYGLSLSSDDDSQYPMLRMPNIHEGRIDVSDLKYVDLNDDELDKYRLEAGDIVFNRTNSIDLVGKVALFDLSDDYVFASYLLRVNVDEERALPEYINYFLNLPHVQARLRALATPGASQANINPTSLKSVRIVLPPIDQQRTIVGALSSARATTKRIEGQERKTLRLKRSLLTEMLTPAELLTEAA